MSYKKAMKRWRSHTRGAMKNYKNEGKMFGQAFNPSGATLETTPNSKMQAETRTRTIAPGVEILPATERYQKRWKVQSFTSGGAYVVALTRDGEWQCSCPHWKFRRPEGGCKHIRRVKAGEGTEKILKPLPEIVFARVWKPKYKPETNELYVPLVAIGDTHMEATICYYLLKYGYSMGQVREMRHIPQQWTAKAIKAYVETNGEAERDPRPHVFGHPRGKPVPKDAA